jgi:hypothetical protein
MLKEIRCGECNGVVSSIIQCDTCGTTLSGGYFNKTGTKFIILKIDDTNHDFCDYHCLMRFLIEEWKKQLPKGDKDEINK